jgi:parallel beta-helix repeat protein
MPRPCGTTLAGLALWALLALLPAGASAEHVRCGDLITQDTTLDSDLLDCPIEGVRIVGSNVTLDLNGHTIDGTREAESGVVSLGLLNTGVTVRGGTVRDFEYGIDFYNADDSVVEDLVARNNRDGGIRVSGRRLVVRRSVAASNPRGIWLDGGSDMVVSDNFAIRNGIGIDLPDANRTTVVRNVLGHNAVGIRVYKASGNRVERNRLEGDRIGILLTHPNDEDPPSGNDFIRNRITRAAEDGIQIQTVGGPTYLTENVVTRSGDDGIQIGDVPAAVTDRSSVLVRNRTHHNADLGIEALPGVIDGGRNRAFRNGNPLQCLIIVCR